MSPAEILVSVAHAGGWFVRLHAGGTLILAVSFILVALVARGSLAARVRVRRGAVAAVLLFGVASIVTPGRWTLVVPGIADVADSPAAAGPEESYAGGDESFSGLGGADVSRQLGAGVSAGVRSGTVVIASVIGIWAIGVAGIVLHLLIGLIGLHRHARRAVDVTGTVSVPDGFCGVRRDVRVLLGGPYRVPICFGLTGSTILLPREAAEWPPDRLRAVVLHELAHINDRDDRLLLCTRLACALYWCNPLVWMLSRVLDREADARCDERVVRTGITATAYARVLVEVAAEGRQPALGVAVHLGHTSSLSWRVTRLLNPPPDSRERLARAGAAVVLLLLVGGACASGRVAFGEASEARGSQPQPTGDQAMVSTVVDAPLQSGAPRVRIIAAVDVNEGRPITVEVVAALSGEAARTLMGTDAAVWFASRTPGRPPVAQVRVLRTIDIVPGTCIVLDLPQLAGADPAGFFLFAGYSRPGQHRVRLDWLRSPVLVQLREHGLNATSDLSEGCADPRRDSSRGGQDKGDPGGVAALPPRGGTTEIGAGRQPAACLSQDVLVGGWTPADLASGVATLLEDSDPGRRQAAARAIARMAGVSPPLTSPPATKDYHHALTAAASDPATAVRIAAICALGQVGDERALEALSWRTADRERQEVRRVALWATTRIRARAGL
ncbi:MAG TPA: M56 family metallopeptidase [Longimicrobiales bacterium]|nr:M56 family metallopeptidase [Longimicrobiales bacterium]